MKPNNQSLLTDLYQLTMSYGYWKQGMQSYEAVFHVYFRENPFQGGFTIACGLKPVIDYLQHFRFTREDVIFLSELTGSDNQPLFEYGFLEYLLNLKFSCTLHAVPEGSVVFPYEPLLRIQGPIIQCQLLETVLLNFINFQTLVATKAARVCLAAQGDEVLEFGLRRAQGPDGGLSASRASYIGGCSGTSNVLAARKWGIPVKGTHAHSWVMAFSQEIESFIAFAQALPNNCVFLVDTYDTITGVKNAIRVGKMMREAGFEMIGIRLDSGDMAQLSIEARKLMDQAGFQNAVIIGSSDLDEFKIETLKQRGAMVNSWGVGTRMVTAFDQPALGGVYKLSAIRPPAGQWVPKMKFSEEPEKASIPGMLQVIRYYQDDQNFADIIVNDWWSDEIEAFDTFEGERIVIQDLPSNKLLQIIFDEGKLVYLMRDIHQIRSYTQRQLSFFNQKYKLFVNPATYPVGLEDRLKKMKAQLHHRQESF